jgi:hypothetical protein
MQLCMTKVGEKSTVEVVKKSRKREAGLQNVGSSDPYPFFFYFHPYLRVYLSHPPMCIIYITK